MKSLGILAAAAAAAVAVGAPGALTIAGMTLHAPAATLGQPTPVEFYAAVAAAANATLAAVGTNGT
jgi:hypothetical protein